MKKEKIPYGEGRTSLIGTLYSPTSKNKTPLILVFPTWSGKDLFIEERAAYLAKLGYASFAVDMYGEEKIGSSKEENRALMKPFIENRLLLQKRVLLAFRKIQSLEQVDSKKIGAIGFCFGGLCALDLARSESSLKAAVSIHGLLLAPPFAYKDISAKILALHGHDDPMVPPDQVLAFEKEMSEKKADWQFHTYRNTMHAFTNPKAKDPSFGTVYQPSSCRRAFFLLEAFLEEVFHD